MGKGKPSRGEETGNVAFEDVLRCKDGLMDVEPCGNGDVDDGYDKSD